MCLRSKSSQFCRTPYISRWREEIAKVKDWPSPRNPKELHSFFGFSGYYRKFVRKCSEIARLLNSLMPPTRKKNDKGPSKMTIWEVEDKHEQFSVLEESPVCCTITGLCRFHETVRASHRRLQRRFRSSTLSSNRWCRESHCLRE